MNHLLASPRPVLKHQSTIQNILVNYLIETKGKEFDIFTEYVPDMNNLNGLIPDVCFYEKGSSKALVIIEIDSEQSFKDYTEDKLQVYFSKKYDYIQEVFVYFYDKQEWRFYELPDEYEFDSYSEVLDIELSTLTNKPNLD